MGVSDVSSQVGLKHQVSFGTLLNFSVWRVTWDHGLLNDVTHRACDASRPWPCAQEIPLTQGSVAQRGPNLPEETHARQRYYSVKTHQRKIKVRTGREQKSRGRHRARL